MVWGNDDVSYFLERIQNEDGTINVLFSCCIEIIQLPVESERDTPKQINK